MTDAKLNLAYLFASPLAELRMPEHEDLCTQLRELFLTRAAEGDEFRNAIRRPTQLGPLFESKFDLFAWPEDCVRQLAAFCHQALATLVASLSNYSPEDLNALRFDYHAWFHITEHGGHQGLHNHQNASWSGIFCVDPGDTVPNRPDSGQVRFHDARGAANMHMDPANQHLQGPAHIGAQNVTHEAGKLLLFPSYLHHEIFPYLGERPRIVVAFNSWATKR